MLATTLIRRALEKFEVHLLAKPHAQELLGPTYPELKFHPWTAPWTAHRGKYRLWKWLWRELWRVLLALRREKFDAAVSVRADPRDHFLMWLSGARRRIGFPVKGSEIFLTTGLRRNLKDRHKVENWRDIGGALEISAIESSGPHLSRERYCKGTNSERAEEKAPIVCLHVGARIHVRRWPLAYFKEILHLLRENFRFYLVLIPDLDGYGSSLSSLADETLSDLTLRKLVDVFSNADLVFCNDSGPMHIAAACGRPTIAVFGPSKPEWFRPWGHNHKVLIRDICPLRPCFDYCAFPEPYCLTKLGPNIVWPEILEQIRNLDLLPPISPVFGQ